MGEYDVEIVEFDVESGQEEGPQERITNLIFWRRRITNLIFLGRVYSQ